MKTSELIKELEQLMSIHGDIDVTIWTDHGQSNTNAYYIGIQYVDEDGETYADEDLNDFEPGAFTKVIEIVG